jgi:hypothetical protein
MVIAVSLLAVFTVDPPASVRDRTRDKSPTPANSTNFGQSGVDQKTTNMDLV